MMATTHVYAGLALVTPLAYLAPELAMPAAVAAAVGSVGPDLDVVVTHRRTLHFPVYGGVVAIPAVVAAAIAPSTVTVAVAAFLVAAWLHAASDALGGGPELDPWTDPRDEAVYDHARDRWVRPRRYVRYDGSPEDFVLGVVLAIPPLFAFDGPIRIALVAGLVIALGYTAFRRRLAAVAPDWLE